MITGLTTTDIRSWMAPGADTFANKPTEKSGLYVYMVSTDAPRTPSFRWHLDRVLSVSFYVVGDTSSDANEVAMQNRINTLDNLLISSTERKMNGKIVYQVEGGIQTPVLYNDKNKPVLIKTYLFHYRASDGSY